MVAKRKAKAKAKRRPRVRISKIACIPLGFHVIGFCDVEFKPRGTGSLTYFRKEHVMITPTLPTQSQLKAYATKHGYFPSGKIAAQKDRCEPVYFHVADVP